MVGKQPKRSWWKNVFRFGESPLGNPIGIPQGSLGIPGISSAAQSSGQVTQQGGMIVPNRSPIGSFGTQSYAGYPSEDYLSQMRGHVRADLFDKMRRSDPQIKMCLAAVTASIQSAHWAIEKAKPELFSDPDAAQEDADLMEHMLFHGMEKTWSQFIHEALTVLPFGHSVFEILDEPVLSDPRFGSYNGIRDLAFRSQRTLYRWNLDPLTGKLVSVTQYAFGDLLRLVDIPAEFLLVFSIDQEGANYEGISALRSCYGNWLRKNNYLKLNAIGIEKHAIPTPIVTVPAGREQGDQFDQMIAVLEAYQVHEKNFLTLPEGWKIDLQTSTYDPQKVEISIDNEDKRMAKAFIANFLELGLNGFGSQSLSFDLSDFFLNSLDCVARQIDDTINRRIMTRMIRLNRGPRPAYPELKHSGITDKMGKEFGDILKVWVDSGIITADDVLEVHLRKRFGMPARDNATSREPITVAVAQAKEKEAIGGGSAWQASSSLIERVQAARRLVKYG